MTKVKSGGAYMMLKTGMEVAQDYTVFNYGSPKSQKFLKYQYMTIVSRPGVNPAPKFVLPGHRKEKFQKEITPRCVYHG